MIQYKRHKRFEKQITKLLGRFGTLEEDLKVAQSAAIELLHERKMDNHSIFLIPGFDDANIKIYKIKKFACKARKGKGVRSGIRIVYAFYPTTSEIEFLEIYYKDKEDSDTDYGFVRSYFKENI